MLLMLEEGGKNQRRLWVDMWRCCLSRTVIEKQFLRRYRISEGENPQCSKKGEKIMVEYGSISGDVVNAQRRGSELTSNMGWDVEMLHVRPLSVRFEGGNHLCV